MSEGDKKIELKDESIILNKVVIDDLNTYKILNDIKEDKREDFIKKAIVIGAIGLRNLYLTENVDYIEKEFKELMKNSQVQSKQIKDMIEKTLDIGNNSSSLGKMRVLFEDYFDKRKGKISDLLSPFEDDSLIKELRDELVKEKNQEEIIEKTALKGGKFEEIVLESIEDICSEYEDKIAPVGEKLGKSNKIGDITIDIEGDENKRIIIECKD